jgi:hypothetical protein
MGRVAVAVMSVGGQKRRLDRRLAVSGLPRQADRLVPHPDFGFGPMGDILNPVTTGHSHLQDQGV